MTGWPMVAATGWCSAVSSTAETASVLGGTLSYGGAAQGATNVGNYALTASGLSSGNYAISYTAGSLAVSRGALTVYRQQCRQDL